MANQMEQAASHVVTVSQELVGPLQETNTLTAADLTRIRAATGCTWACVVVEEDPGC